MAMKNFTITTVIILKMHHRHCQLQTKNRSCLLSSGKNSEKKDRDYDCANQSLQQYAMSVDRQHKILGLSSVLTAMADAASPGRSLGSLR